MDSIDDIAVCEKKALLLALTQKVTVIIQTSVNTFSDLKQKNLAKVHQVHRKTEKIRPWGIFRVVQVAM